MMRDLRRLLVRSGDDVSCHLSESYPDRVFGKAAPLLCSLCRLLMRQISPEYSPWVGLPCYQADDLVKACALSGPHPLVLEALIFALAISSFLTDSSSLIFYIRLDKPILATIVPKQGSHYRSRSIRTIHTQIIGVIEYHAISFHSFIYH